MVAAWYRSSVLLLAGVLQGVEVTELAQQAHRKEMPLLIGIMPRDDQALQDVAQRLVQQLGRSGQFAVTVRSYETPSKQSELNALFDKAFPLAIFLHHSHDGNAIDWRVYDVPDKKLIKGRTYSKKGTHAYGYAANLADALWPVLTSQPSSFSSKLAYVKRIKTMHGRDRQRSVVCISNIDGSQEQTIISRLGTYVGLYWHHDAAQQCLFCSEFTRYNVRFISSNLFGRVQTVLNLPGTCVGISVAHDSDRAVYCRSGRIWQYRHDPSKKEGVHTSLVANEGKNMCPTLLKMGDIIFCSDAMSLKKEAPSRGPKIYRYRAHDGSTEMLTKEGYCVGPSYSPQVQKVAYSKKIKGTMQICVYDMRKKTDTQLTFDGGNKIDCCWSPCGASIAYCLQKGRSSRIAIMNLAMKTSSFVTPANQWCTCPAWSPTYEEVPYMKRFD